MGHSGLSYWASGSLATMTVNDEGTHLVASLVPWHARVTGVCLAGAGPALWECMEEAQAVNKCAAFSLLEKTSSGWRPSRLPAFPCGHAGMWPCGMSLSCGRRAGASTAELLQLSFTEEVENNHISVPHCLQAGWCRAEMGKSC